MPDLVLYHAGCWDGFCAAWLAHKAFPDAQFVPVQYGQEPPDVTGRDVWILDFSYKRPVLLAMKEKAKDILVADHHKTAQADLEGLDWCIFDMEKSGARLTWELLWDNKLLPAAWLEDRPSLCNLIAPWLVDYTEDRDLWRWSLPSSKAVNAALRTFPLEFALWDRLAKKHADELVQEGNAIIRYQQKLIESHVNHAYETDISGHKVLCVNCTCADLTSEVAGELAKDRPFGVCWFEAEEGNMRVFSLRSRDGGIDVSEIAKAHGGGGHARAAGFSVPATGAVGSFSRPQLNNDDEGDLRVAIAADKKSNVVVMNFGKKVAWLALPKQEALSFCDIIRKRAYEL